MSERACDRAQALGLSTSFLLITALFFAWGAANAITDPLLVTLRASFRLTWAEALSTQIVFFAAFGLVSLPAAALGDRIGPVRSILVALAVMIAGCLLVRLSLALVSFWPILAALFVLASGITILQVAANPMAAVAGPPQSSHFRLNFAQAFNSLGMIVGVHWAAWVLFGGAEETLAPQAPRLASVGVLYTILAAVLCALLVSVWVQRHRLAAHAPPEDAPVAGSPFAALRSRWALAGALAIALYVGAEVSIGSVMIGFLNQPEVMALPLRAGGERLATIYWGGALVGRLIGILLLVRARAAILLAANAMIAALLCLTASAASGPVAGWAALAVGLFNSIMFPVIFSLTLERSGLSRSATSGLLCCAIAGGGALPLVVGRIADGAGLASALAVPAAAYAFIALFAIRAARD